MSKKRIIWLAIIIMICVGGYIGWTMWNKPFSDPLTADAVKVTSTQLFQEFSMNETDAQKKYVPEKVDGRAVEVTGEIKDTGKNTDGERFYVLNAGDEMFGVKCILDKANNATNAKPGDKVTIRGFCTGFNMDVILNRCKQVK